MSTPDPNEIDFLPGLQLDLGRAERCGFPEVLYGPGKSIDNVIEALTNNDQAQAVREMIGLTKGSPAEIVKRLEMLVLGSVVPKIELPLAVKLAEAFPIEFLTLTNKITALTGMGFDIVKPEAASQPITH